VPPFRFKMVFLVLPAVTFPSMMDFDITSDVTLLWQLLPDDSPAVVARYGNIKKIDEKHPESPRSDSKAPPQKGSIVGRGGFIGATNRKFQRASRNHENDIAEKKLQVDLALPCKTTRSPTTISWPIQDGTALRPKLTITMWSKPENRQPTRLNSTKNRKELRSSRFSIQPPAAGRQFHAEP